MITESDFILSEIIKEVKNQEGEILDLFEKISIVKIYISEKKVDHLIKRLDELFKKYKNVIYRIDILDMFLELEKNEKVWTVYNITVLKRG